MRRNAYRLKATHPSFWPLVNPYLFREVFLSFGCGQRTSVDVKSGPVESLDVFDSRITSYAELLHLRVDPIPTSAETTDLQSKYRQSLILGSIYLSVKLGGTLHAKEPCLAEALELILPRPLSEPRFNRLRELSVTDYAVVLLLPYISRSAPCLSKVHITRLAKTLEYEDTETEMPWAECAYAEALAHLPPLCIDELVVMDCSHGWLFRFLTAWKVHPARYIHLTGDDTWMCTETSHYDAFANVGSHAEFKQLCIMLKDQRVNRRSLRELRKRQDLVDRLEECWKGRGIIIYAHLPYPNVPIDDLVDEEGAEEEVFSWEDTARLTKTVT